MSENFGPKTKAGGHVAAMHFALAKLVGHLADKGAIDLDAYLFSLTNNAQGYRATEPLFSEGLDALAAEIKNLHSQGK